MTFIILFIVGALAVPLALDISKHGKNNILRRSGEDLLDYPSIQSVIRSSHITIGHVNAVALSTVSFALLVLIGYFVYECIAIIISLIEAITR